MIRWSSRVTSYRHSALLRRTSPSPRIACSRLLRAGVALEPFIRIPTTRGRIHSPSGKAPNGTTAIASPGGEDRPARDHFILDNIRVDIKVAGKPIGKDE